MEDKPQYAPRVDPTGRYERVCPYCKKSFRTNNPRSVYDTEECKAAAAFARWYAKPRNQKRVRQRAKVRMRKLRKLARQ